MTARSAASKTENLDPYAIEVGDRLRRIRHMYRMTLITFGKLIGGPVGDVISESRMSHFENGHRVLPPYLAISLKRKTGVPLEWFYDGDGAQMSDQLRRALMTEAERDATALSHPIQKSPEELWKDAWIAGGLRKIIRQADAMLAVFKDSENQSQAQNGETDEHSADQ